MIINPNTQAFTKPEKTSKNSTIKLNLSESIDYELAKDASIVLNLTESAN